MHEELHVKKVVSRWLLHNPTEHQKEENVRMSKETLTLLNYDGQCKISKIDTSDERSTGLVKPNKLDGQKAVTANWYTVQCLPEILQEVNVKGLLAHHGNPFSHTAKLTVEFLKQKQIKVTEHPP
ncbi:uncharacterized protein TNCV_4766991 [Trichonephila clavipes]|nr:uncharacterized protein TNCV_4766991 [Trichonephila clavipes]